MFTQEEEEKEEEQKEEKQEEEEPGLWEETFKNFHDSKPHGMLSLDTFSHQRVSTFIHLYVLPQTSHCKCNHFHFL